MNFKFVCSVIILGLVEITLSEGIERKWTSKSGHTIIAKLSHHDATNIYLFVNGNVKSVSKSLFSQDDIDYLKKVTAKQKSNTNTKRDQLTDTFLPTKEQLNRLDQLLEEIVVEGDKFKEFRNDFGTTEEQAKEAEKLYLKKLDQYYLHLHTINPVVFPNISDFTTKELSAYYLKVQKRIEYLDDNKLMTDPKYGFHFKHYGITKLYLIMKYVDFANREIRNGRTPAKISNN
jgi:hypothetical protein